MPLPRQFTHTICSYPVGKSHSPQWIISCLGLVSRILMRSVDRVPPIDRTTHTSSVLSTTHSSIAPSRSSSFGTPESKAGLMWRPRSHSFGPESVLDLQIGRADSLGRQDTPAGPGLESAQYGHLSRDTYGGAGEVRAQQAAGS